MSRIKDELSRYSHRSVYVCTLNHLIHRGEVSSKRALMMPWVVLFLLKVSLLGESGPDEIDARKYNRIANDIWLLQGAAISLTGDDFELNIRAMLLGQLMYQRDTTIGMRELCLQGSVFTRVDNYYDKLFYEFFGLSLDSYLKIAMFVVVRLENQPEGIILKLPIAELIIFLCPGIPYTHILAFIRLACCDIESLAGYVKGYDLGDIYVSEYFQETPFKYVPFVLEGDCLVAFNYQFCITALCGLAPAVLKKECPAFKDEFGKDMERRVGGIIAPFSCDEILDEEAISLIFKSVGVKSKVVDYLVREGDQITLIECKAIEPTDLMKCTSDGAILKKVLEQNYIKAIHQGQAVANALSELAQFKGCEFRLLVVTYGDHYIFGGEYISKNIDMTLVDVISEKYGGVPIPMCRISYLPLQDFSALIHGLTDKELLLNEFLDAACDAQSDPQTRRMTLAHLVHEQLGSVAGSFAAGLGDEIDRKLKALEALVMECPRYWNGKAEYYMGRHASLLRALNPTYQDLRIK
ncbi:MULTISPECIES: GapS1 family protein [Pseudomonas]|uniref:GapS1 family protein n=1 Tax=Pseudomonas TaxID=286 RepID=UPI001140BDB6|nr:MULTISPECIES: hypothetical protein [unclassified Pseudomonas]MCV2230286.1 hypothetical protein [Pseudomonas sp. AU10]